MIHNRYKKYCFTILVLVFSFLNANAETKDQHTKVMLREIGNEFLLQLFDSTSRILPIEINEERYALKFDRLYSFEPDFLAFSVFKIFEKYGVKDTYIIEVEDCNTGELVHSFKTDSITKDSGIACRKRLQPEGCHFIYFTLVSDKEDSKSSKGYLYFVIPFIIGIGLFLLVKNKKKPNSNLYKIGNYLFDKKEMTLSINKQSTELSSMETNLLYLLFSNENKTIEREEILEKVWGDEGNYVGRTLDVFISKLRKKLEEDSKIKIVNVRGVGYKMVIS